MSVSDLRNKCYLWCFNIEELKCESANDPEWLTYFDTLQTHEQERVKRFHFLDDRKRSLVSFLSQKALIKFSFSCSDLDFRIERTRENKPFVASSKLKTDTWNFNVSHHGRYVCIGSHSSLLIGVDLVDISTRSKFVSSVTKYVEMFSQQFDPMEMDFILRQRTEVEQYNMFFIYWSLKESYIKAIGLGLGFDLKEINFEVKLTSFSTDVEANVQSNEKPVNPASSAVGIRGTASATISGRRRDDWRFDFWSVDEKHVIAVALGPLADATPSYQSAAWPGGLAELIGEGRQKHAELSAVGVFSSLSELQIASDGYDVLKSPLPKLYMQPLDILIRGATAAVEEDTGYLMTPPNCHQVPDFADSVSTSDLFAEDAVKS